jgi:hypothetical protein
MNMKAKPALGLLTMGIMLIGPKQGFECHHLVYKSWLRNPRALCTNFSAPHSGRFLFIHREHFIYLQLEVTSVAQKRQKNLWKVFFPYEITS